jgi:hypothetical protein
MEVTMSATIAARSASGGGFEIVRRRLFTPVKDETAREQTCLAYSRLYGGDSADFPRQCAEAQYLERLRAAYPIHPEVFDRLYDDWASLERFQRTRGVLRLMAAAIHALWVRGDRSLLIQPGSLPLDTPRVRDEILRYLPEGWNTVMDRDVDGERSEPRRIDEENPRLGALVAAERVARTIFLGSAPHHAQQRVRGIEDVRVRLGVAQPGESVAVFNDALGRLSDRLTYLYSGNHRYWYDTHPNLRRTAEDRASRLEGYEVTREIEARLRREREKGDFRAVSWWADPSGSDVADEQAVRLVVLQAGHRYRRTRMDAEALVVASRILEQRGNSPRRFRNMLVFVVPDAEAMEGLDLEVRRYLAWKSIVDEQEILNLDAHQRRQAQDSAKRADETVSLRLREAYSWLLVPSQEAGGAWQWEATRILGDGSILAPQWARPHRVVQVAIQVGQFLVQEGDVPLDVTPDGRQGGVQALPLRGAHADELAPPGQQGAQLLGVGVGEWTRRGVHHFGEAGEELGVEGVGLGQLADGAGEVAHLARVDHRHSEARGRQRGGHRQLPPAGRLQDDEGGALRPQPCDERGDALLVVGDNPLLRAGARGDIQLGLGDIDAPIDGGAGWVHDGVLSVPTRPFLGTCGPRRPCNCAGSGEKRARRPALSCGLARPKEDRPAVPLCSST